MQSEDELEFYQVAVTKDSGYKKLQSALRNCKTGLHGKLELLIEECKLNEAVELCDEAIRSATEAASKLESLLCRAHISLKQGNTSKALEDVSQVIQAEPGWHLAYERQAEVYMALGKYAAAAKSCRIAEGIADAKSSSQTSLTLLQDRIAQAAALQGKLDGFDGRQLEVRSAGEDAWLGGPAAEDPALDGANEEQNNGVADKLLPAADALGGRDAQNALSNKLRTSYRSIKEAVDAAKDGDRIVLMRGTHNGMGEAFNINKRLHISGLGVLGEVKVDQRANSPTFRISRSCVIQNLDLDMTGFRECLCIAGPDTMHTLIERCSGDDAVNLCEKSAAVLRGCTLQARKVGLRAVDNAQGTLLDCRIQDCGEEGLSVMDGAQIDVQRPASIAQTAVTSTNKPAFLIYRKVSQSVFSCRCSFISCKQEACVVMDHGELSLQKCKINSCEGPAIDVSGQGRADLSQCAISRNAGGIWMWDESRLAANSCRIDDCSSFPLLVQGMNKPAVKQCHFIGKIDVTDPNWAEVNLAENHMLRSE